jgi:hypothetical protein
MGMRSRTTVLATAVVAVAGLAGTASLPAHAAAESTKAAAASSYYLHFDKISNTNSRLYLKQSVPGTDRILKSYRAGSGVTTNECTRNKGWLPTKSYTVKKWNTSYNGSFIKGYAFQLNDTKCKNGSTSRTELFIHSEMTRGGGQGSTEPTRWDGAGDYKSAGCIKMSPNDIKDLYKRAKAVGFPSKLVVTN